jgi:hypothetical protein
MVPQDIFIFQVLAGLFTLSFMAMLFLLWKFMQDLKQLHAKLMGLASKTNIAAAPVLHDLQAGALQLPFIGERTPPHSRLSADIDIPLILSSNHHPHKREERPGSYRPRPATPSKQTGAKHE